MKTISLGNTFWDSNLQGSFPDRETVEPSLRRVPVVHSQEGQQPPPRTVSTPFSDAAALKPTQVDVAGKALQNMATSWQRSVPVNVKPSRQGEPFDPVALASNVLGQKKAPGGLKALSGSNASGRSAADTAAPTNVYGNKLVNLTSKTLSTFDEAVGLASSVDGLSSDVKALLQHPDDNQAKWNVGNNAAHLAVGLAATAASFAFPPAILAPLLLPNFAEIPHAERLRKTANDMRAQGRNVEADAVHADYQAVALNATPIINWFSRLYTPLMRPAIESFELAQGNQPGASAAGDLLPTESGNRAVLDYYGKALKERAQQLGSVAKDELKKAATDDGYDSVTLISHAPQMFGWPSTGEAMRVLDRSIAITYSKKTDSISARFFGKGDDGVFRLSTLNKGVSTGLDKKNVVLVSNLLDPAKESVKFDLAAYKHDRTGSVYFVDPRRSAT